MDSVSHVVVEKRYVRNEVGRIVFDISHLAFTLEDDYYVFSPCGHMFVECNDHAASPPVLNKTASQFSIQSLTPPIELWICAAKGVGKGDI